MNMNDVPKNGSKIDIHEMMMTIRLNCSYGLVNRVKDKVITEEVNTIKKTRGLLVSRERFPEESGKYLKALHSKLQEFYAYHSNITMDSVYDGERLIPTMFVLGYSDKFREYDPMVENAFVEFEDHYDGSILMVKHHPEFGKTFNPDNYPPKAELRGLLHFQMQMLPLPKASQGLLNAIGECVQTDLDRFMDKAVTTAFQGVNTRIKEGLERMVEQLSDPKKKVYDTLTGSMDELCNRLIPSFNVTNDDSLNLLAQEIRDRILIYKPDDLRNDIILRQQAADGAADILKRMGF